VNDLWRFDLVKNEWSEVDISSNGDGKSPSARHNHSAVVWGGAMWIFGGSSSNTQYHNQLWKFDLHTHQWTLVTPNYNSTPPFPRHGHSAVVWGDKMVIFGGKSDAQTCAYYNDVHVYDFVENSWRQMHCKPIIETGTPEDSSSSSSSMPHVRCWHSAVVLEKWNWMVVFGGFWWDPNGRRGRGMEYYFNDLFVLDLVSETWQEVHPSGDIPARRNRHIAAILPLRKFQSQKNEKENEKENLEKENEKKKKKEKEKDEEKVENDYPEENANEKESTDDYGYQMIVQGGNFYVSGSRKDVFYDDAFVLFMESPQHHHRQPQEGTSSASASASSFWHWKRLPALQQPHLPLPIPTPISTSSTSSSTSTSTSSSSDSSTFASSTSSTPGLSMSTSSSFVASSALSGPLGSPSNEVVCPPPRRGHHTAVVVVAGVDNDSIVPSSPFSLVVFGGERRRQRFNDVIRVAFYCSEDENDEVVQQAFRREQEQAEEVNNSSNTRGRGRGRGRGKGRGGDRGRGRGTSEELIQREARTRAKRKLSKTDK
jgi:hypothetical protein